MALELGACQVKYGTSGSEVDLGKTLGGVVVKISEEGVDLKSDQYGSSPEDTVLTGGVCEVDVPMAEVGFDALSIVLQQDLIGAASGVIGENNVGTSLLTNSKSLILVKYVDGAPSTALTDVVHFPAAGVMPNAEITYDAENQRVVNTTFKCFPKVVNANWGTASPNDKTVRFWFGDETAMS